MRRTIIIAIILSVFVLISDDVSCSTDIRAVLTFTRGAYFEARGDYQNAYRYYSYALGREPGVYWIKIAVARTALEIGYLDIAHKYSKEVIDSGKYFSEASMILALTEYLKGNKEEAQRVLENLRSKEDFPRFQVLKLLSKIYIEMGKIDDAMKVLEEAKKLFPDDTYINYRLGSIYLRKKEYKRAIDAFKAVVEMSPEVLEAHLAIASIYRHIGKLGQAELYYRNVLKLDPTNKDALEELTDLYNEHGLYEKGIELLAPLYDSGALENRFVVKYGRFLFEAGKIEEAFKLFTALLERNGENPPLLRIISQLEMERGYLKSAYGYLKKAVEIEPDNFDNYAGLLLIAFDLVGKPSGEDERVDVGEDEKMEYLEKASRCASTKEFKDNYILGVIYGELDELEKAESFLKRAEKADPSNRRVLMELSSCFEKQGKLDEAIVRLKKLYDQFPDDPSIANFYGYVLAEKGENLDFAEKIIRQALDMRPDNGYYLDSLGWVFYRKGRLYDALRELKKAVKLVDNDAVIWQHLGEVQESLGDIKEAIKAYEKSLKLDPDNNELKKKLNSLRSR